MHFSQISIGQTIKSVVIYIEVKERNNASCMVVDMILNVCDIENGDYSEDAIRAYKYNDVIIIESNCKLYLLDSNKYNLQLLSMIITSLYLYALIASSE